MGDLQTTSWVTFRQFFFFNSTFLYGMLAGEYMVKMSFINAYGKKPQTRHGHKIYLHWHYHIKLYQYAEKAY